MSRQWSGPTLCAQAAEGSSDSLCDNSQQALGSSTGSLSSARCSQSLLSHPWYFFFPSPRSLPLKIFSFLMLILQIAL